MPGGVLTSVFANSSRSNFIFFISKRSYLQKCTTKHTNKFNFGLTWCTIGIMLMQVFSALHTKNVQISSKEQSNLELVTAQILFYFINKVFIVTVCNVPGHKSVWYNPQQKHKYDNNNNNRHWQYFITVWRLTQDIICNCFLLLSTLNILTGCYNKVVANEWFWYLLYVNGSENQSVEV